MIQRKLRNKNIHICRSITRTVDTSSTEQFKKTNTFTKEISTPLQRKIYSFNNINTGVIRMDKVDRSTLP